MPAARALATVQCGCGMGEGHAGTGDDDVEGGEVEAVEIAERDPVGRRLAAGDLGIIPGGDVGASRLEGGGDSKAGAGEPEDRHLLPCEALGCEHRLLT